MPPGVDQPDFALNSEYAIRQKSSGFYLDAFQPADEQADEFVRLRGNQNNATQRWQFIHVGWAYRIQQVSSGRYLDAWPDEAHDRSAVLRTLQLSDGQVDSQIWLATDPSGFTNTRYRQLSTGWFLDAHPGTTGERNVVIRGEQNDSSQVWTHRNVNWNGPPWSMTQLSQYVSSPFGWGSQFLDAHQNDANDWSVVNRGHQGDDTQQWHFETVGFIYEIQQVSSGLYLDAYLGPQNWNAVMRPRQERTRPNTGSRFQRRGAHGTCVSFASGGTSTPTSPPMTAKP